MQGPLLPSPFDDIGQRRFSFYPSITNAEPNDWFMRNANWSEVQVVNSRTKQEISIPRQYIGSISETDDPVVIVGLTKELELRKGTVWPRVKRVIEMPVAVNSMGSSALRKPWLYDAAQQRKAPAPVIGIRLEDDGNSRKGRLAAYLGVGAALVSLLVVVVCRDWVFSGRFANLPASEATVGFTSSDDYATVIRRMGVPATDTWHPNGSLQMRALTYPRRAITVILLGPDREHMRYAATLDFHRSAQIGVEAPDGSGPATGLSRTPAHLR
jgi:hypothetical protein